MLCFCSPMPSMNAGAHIARLDPARVGPLYVRARGTSQRDHVTGLQRQDAGTVGEHLPQVVLHAAGVRVLLDLAVQHEVVPHVPRVRHEFLRHDVGTDGSEGVVVLLDQPVRAATHLAIAASASIGHIDLDAVAEYVVRGRCHRDILRRLADHDRELAFPVDLLAPPWQDDVVVRADHGGRRLDEQVGIVGTGIAGGALPDARRGLPEARAATARARRSARARRTRGTGGARGLLHDARRMFGIVRARVEDDRRTHGRQHLHRIDRG